MTQEKLTSLTEAVDRLIPDGAVVAAGTCLESLIPFAAGREIIRRKKNNLTLVGPISDILFDQLIGAGCVREVRAAWVGNVITGSGYCFRRAVESGRLPVIDHSNLTISMAFKAAAMGVPFMPVKTALGSDLLKTNPDLIPFTCPVTGAKLIAVAALTPDVAVIHVQRADPYGNAHMWGNWGISREACLAANRVLITAEEIVDPDTIRRDPNRVVTPGFRVAAVCKVPWGAHPSPVPGYYNRDHRFFLDYRNESNTAAGYEAWKQRYVIEAPDQTAYLAQLGKARLTDLRIKNPAPSLVVDYGY